MSKTKSRNKKSEQNKLPITLGENCPACGCNTGLYALAIGFGRVTNEFVHMTQKRQNFFGKGVVEQLNIEGQLHDERSTAPKTKA